LIFKAEVTGELTVQSHAMVLLDLFSNPEKLAERLPNLTDEQILLMRDTLPALLTPPSPPIEGESNTSRGDEE
jgi:hypothetical protein